MIRFRTATFPHPAASAALAAVALLGCGGTPDPETGLGTGGAAAQETSPAGWDESLETTTGRTLPPAGYGTLSQNNITVALEAGTLLIRAVPLTEWVIRLTAPDTYRRLNGYKVNRGPEILDAAGRAGEDDWPLVLFVTFYTRSLEDTFEPHDLWIRSQNFVYRPMAILPVTPDFNRNRLRQEESQIALYLFSSDIDLDLPMTVVYGDAESGRWAGIRSVLDRELSLVLSRAGAKP